MPLSELKNGSAKVLVLGSVDFQLVKPVNLVLRF